VTLNFKPAGPANGETAITGYAAAALLNGTPVTLASTTGKSVGNNTQYHGDRPGQRTAYTFTVTATNAGGTSAASSASALVTPSTTPNFSRDSQRHEHQRAGGRHLRRAGHRRSGRPDH